MAKPTAEDLAKMSPKERLPHIFGPLELLAIGFLIGWFVAAVF